MPKNTAKYKTLRLSYQQVDGIDSIQRNYGYDMSVITLNSFFICSGILPDIPVGWHEETFEKDGVWRRRVVYTQYDSWEDHITEYFGQITFWKN